MSLPTEVKFYSNVKPMIAINIALGFFFAVIPAFTFNGRVWIWVAFGSAVMILGTIVLLGARKIWPVHAGPEGVRTYDGLGIYSDLRWEDIAGVNKALGYYWINTSSGKTLTVPTYLEEMQEFRAYVRRYAPDDNPLRLAM